MTMSRRIPTSTSPGPAPRAFAPRGIARAGCSRPDGRYLPRGGRWIAASLLRAPPRRAPASARARQAGAGAPRRAALRRRGAGPSAAAGARRARGVAASNRRASRRMSVTTEAQVGMAGIIGAGARTALGRSLPASAAAVRAGIANIGRLRFVVDRTWARSQGRARRARLPEHLDGAAPTAGAENAAGRCSRAALHRSGLRGRARASGCSSACPSPARGARTISTARWRGRSRRTRAGAIGSTRSSSIPGHHAAALLAMEQAVGLLRRGEADLCLVGGVDSYLEIATLRWLEETDRLHAARRPWGFTLRERRPASACSRLKGWLEEKRADAPVLALRGVPRRRAGAHSHEDRVRSMPG